MMSIEFIKLFARIKNDELEHSRDVNLMRGRRECERRSGVGGVECFTSRAGIDGLERWQWLSVQAKKFAAVVRRVHNAKTWLLCCVRNYVMTAMKFRLRGNICKSHVADQSNDDDDLSTGRRREINPETPSVKYCRIFYELMDPPDSSPSLGRINKNSTRRLHGKSFLREKLPISGRTVKDHHILMCLM